MSDTWDDFCAIPGCGHPKKKHINGGRGACAVGKFIDKDQTCMCGSFQTVEQVLRAEITALRAREAEAKWLIEHRDQYIADMSYAKFNEFVSRRAEWLKGVVAANGDTAIKSNFTRLCKCGHKRSSHRGIVCFGEGCSCSHFTESKPAPESAPEPRGLTCPNCGMVVGRQIPVPDGMDLLRGVGDPTVYPPEPDPKPDRGFRVDGRTKFETSSVDIATDPRWSVREDARGSSLRSIDLAQSVLLQAERERIAGKKQDAPVAFSQAVCEGNPTVDRRGSQIDGGCHEPCPVCVETGVQNCALHGLPPIPTPQPDVLVDTPKLALSNTTPEANQLRSQLDQANATIRSLRDGLDEIHEHATRHNCPHCTAIAEMCNELDGGPR